MSIDNGYYWVHHDAYKCKYRMKDDMNMHAAEGDPSSGSCEARREYLRLWAMQRHSSGYEDIPVPLLPEEPELSMGGVALTFLPGRDVPIPPYPGHDV